jgi:hypothetical protein
MSDRIFARRGPEPRSRVRVAAAIAGCWLLLALVAAAFAPVRVAAVPLEGESCPPVAPGATIGVACGEGRAGSGGGDATGGVLNLGTLLPILGVGLGGAALVLVAIVLVLRRNASRPAAPADPSEWWTCRNCGRNNVIGSPRCYACGAWQG